jgi:hypothetical protein
MVECPYSVSSNQNLNLDIFIIGRFRDFERFLTIAKRTLEA